MSSIPHCWCSFLMFLRNFSSSSCLLLHNSNSLTLNSNSLCFFSPCSPVFCLEKALMTLSRRTQLQISSLENAQYFLTSSSLVQSTAPNQCFNLVSHLSFDQSSFKDLLDFVIQEWVRMPSRERRSSGFKTNILLIRSLQAGDSSPGILQLSNLMLVFTAASLRLLVLINSELKGLLPVHNSQISTPMLHTSILQSCKWDSQTISGAKQSSVPQQVSLLLCQLLKLDHPKSANFRSSSLLIRIFQGLMSL